MRTAFELKLRQVWLRCQGNVLLDELAIGLAGAGAAWLSATAVERVFGLAFTKPWMVPAAVGAWLLAAAILFWRRRLSKMDAAVAIDQQLELRERFSTALAMCHSDDAFAVAACAEAHAAAEQVRVDQVFRLRPTRRWFWPAGCWMAAIVAFAYLPVMDVLGNQQQQQQDQARQKQAQQARTDLKEALAKVELRLQPLKDLDPTLSKDLAKLAELADQAAPNDLRPEAIKRLEDLAEKLNTSRQFEKLQVQQDLQDMLKDLRGSPKGLSNELNQALARGQFDKAEQILKELARKADEQSLSPEQKEALQRQLQNLAQQMDKAAQNRQPVEDAMREQGIPAEQARQLAKLDPKELEQALEKQGLSREQAEKIANECKACRQASDQMQKIAKAMADAAKDGQVSAQELDELAGMLKQLEGASQDVASREAAEEEIKAALDRLGKAAADGQDGQPSDLAGGTGPWKPGDAQNQGQGTGGPGRGYGQRPTGEPEQTSVEPVRSPSKPNNEVPPVASWYFKGEQVKGEAQRPFKQVVQAARNGAADAINENEIPRKYESAVKKYFGDLEKSRSE